MTINRFVIRLRVVGPILITIVLFGCAEPAPPPPPPPPAPQVSFVPLSDQLEGNWSATYPDGARKVSILDDPQLGDHNYVGRLIDGNYGTIHAGEVLFTASPNASVPDLVNGVQKCSLPGRMGLARTRMTITIQDQDHFTETLVNPGACAGFPIKFTRIAKP